MAKQVITLGCGHESEVQLFGPHAARKRRIEWLREHGECQACRRAAQDAAAAEAAERLGELPALVGSPKQIAWAEKIRALRLVEAKAEAKAANAEDRFAALAAKTSAAWWIDNRHDSGADLLWL